MSIEAENDSPGEEENHGCPNGSRKIAIDMLDAYLGEQGSTCGKDGREKCPENPTHS